MSQLLHDQPAGRGPWRVVVYDPAPDDPRFLLATVELIEPASSQSPPLGWARQAVGDISAVLVPMLNAAAWRIEASR